MCFAGKIYRFMLTEHILFFSVHLKTYIQHCTMQIIATHTKLQGETEYAGFHVHIKADIWKLKSLWRATLTYSLLFPYPQHQKLLLSFRTKFALWPPWGRYSLQSGKHIYKQITGAEQVGTKPKGPLGKAYFQSLVLMCLTEEKKLLPQSEQFSREHRYYQLVKHC